MFFFFNFPGQKKLGKVITPDPWKSGARNTTGKVVLELLLTTYSIAVWRIMPWIINCMILSGRKNTFGLNIEYCCFDQIKEYIFLWLVYQYTDMGRARSLNLPAVFMVLLGSVHLV